MDRLEDLVSLRRRLRVFCQSHGPSVELFRKGSSFDLTPNEPIGTKTTILRHLTTTATCVESLLVCPDPPTDNDYNVKAHARDFSKLALARNDWTSEDSAKIYCRCRGLPLVVERVEDASLPVALSEIRYILAQLDRKKTNTVRQGIGEIDLEDKTTPPEDWYAPNAYHTYWTLEILKRLKERSETAFAEFIEAHDLLRLWARAQLGVQISLHGVQSPLLDTDQLGWALASHMSEPKAIESGIQEQDLLKSALTCLFAHQEPNGNWRRQRPLFHYRNAGNAYSYIFELFAILLQLSLADHSEYCRHELHNYAAHMEKLLAFAERTRIPLDGGVGRFGWTSGHRANQTLPEGWATASVFSFAQGFRRLVGIWTRDAAARRFRTFQEADVDHQKAIEQLRERGDTWRVEGDLSVADELMITFVNPVLSRQQDGRSHLDPDSPVIEQNGARSAILFGPPGTSKTSIAKAVAGALGWSFVELHASDFLSDGLANVYRTTERIFLDLMELDHCVILLDEIDELVRRRAGEPDASERFLTTSMLPKVAELWKQRRVIYLVATNYVEEFDAAITRAQRFDALISMPPPAYRRKLGELCKILRGGANVTFRFADDVKNAVDDAVHSVKERVLGVQAVREQSVERALKDAELAGENILAKFLLVRWDQLPELAMHLRDQMGSSKIVEIKHLRDALARLQDRRLGVIGTYADYFAGLQSIRRDFGAQCVWRLEGWDEESAKEWAKGDSGLRVNSKRRGDNHSVWLARNDNKIPPTLGDNVRLERLSEKSGTLRVIDERLANSQTSPVVQS